MAFRNSYIERHFVTTNLVEKIVYVSCKASNGKIVFFETNFQVRGFEQNKNIMLHNIQDIYMKKLDSFIIYKKL